jgi:hypothetical protein
MKLLRFLGRHPIAVFGVVAVAFLGWVWRDAYLGPQPAKVPGKEIALIGPPTTDMPDIGIPPRRPLPPRPIPQLPPDQRGAPTNFEVLQQLKPGMTRAQVEEIVGAPAANDIHPVTIADGKATYHTTYEADLGAPPTVRPIETIKPIPKAHPGPARNKVTLEFDATQPGHPLLGIYYPDPLF